MSHSMSHSHTPPTELELLLEALCEDRMTPDEAQRLEHLVLSSPEARWHYLTYLDLHGTLYWDAAGAGSPEPLSSQEVPIYVAPEQIPSKSTPLPLPTWIGSKHHHMRSMIGAVAVCLTIGMVALLRTTTPPSTIAVTPDKAATHETAMAGQPGPRPSAPRTNGQPVEIELGSVPLISSNSFADPEATVTTKSPIPTSSSQTIVAQINDDIAAHWKEVGIQPSAQAEDSEWMRRLYLDLLGRVPTVREAESFLGDQREQKREVLVDELLDDLGFVRNFTTKWTNLLIGRSSHPQVNREALEKFLRLSFAANRPWNEIVAELISAEGNNVENGATNFLIAHLNNNAAPATAVCSKVFLGRQIHCNQCHNNPFDESKQIAFWEMNSFFQQTKTVNHMRHDPGTGRMVKEFTELSTFDSGGPTYYETRNGLMKVAYPRFNDADVDPRPETNRRRELARLMTSGHQPQLAAAFVNRLWDHFFGSGFTRVVDDMGPHAPVSHPELLAVLSEQFIQSGYDVKQLIRWICRSDAYQLSSRFSDSNLKDDPMLGELPAFSRMYVRPLTAEQTYDSLLTATKAHQVGAVDWIQAEQNRQKWLQQFVVDFHNDDNDEAIEFEGSIGNALSLMNGPLIEKALETSAGSFLGEIVRQKSSETEKIRSLCLATLSRPPSAGELASMKKQLRQAATSRGGKEHPVEAYQDLFWALLNSNEFASNH